jgi:hypothetical protein
MVLLTNIDSWIQPEDIFVAWWINECWQIELTKVIPEEVDCPISGSFSSSSISGNVIPWCYDGTQTVTLIDSDLIAGNIKLWETIMWVTWTFSWIGSVSWNNIVMPNWALSAPIPLGNYDWAETITASDTNLIAWNILNWVNIFGVTGTYVGDPLPSAFANVWFHVWQTHWPTYQTPYLKYGIPVETKVAQDANNIYLCYSSYVPWSFWLNYYSVVRYNAWTLTTILHKCEAASTYYWHRCVFTQSPNAWKFLVVYWYDSFSTYYCAEITIATWAVSPLVYVSFLSPGLPSTGIFGWFTYEPILATTSYFDTSSSYLDPYTALACNVNIYP